MITAFSFARNGWVNYFDMNSGVDKNGRAIRFRHARDFAYRNKADAVANLEPSPEIAAEPLKEPMAKIVLLHDV